ncbi:uncharacterized protein F5Z01DRAFT_687599 [Emericellopsis atlantica]|uniref:Uncharacterized protein n=1 Tax=Emericellopsis atlantica TaxID=2614577 RepID=A0A9P8CPE0_9HYPO|nr:uncharacterized protein F5Z01DRAFT_687599 [Emericellopsis atlantica]KAG9254097.1 hypothetical protein F5Z01DRAFT_687599 [Emericellopsis atlantica]
MPREHRDQPIDFWGSIAYEWFADEEERKAMEAAERRRKQQEKEAAKAAKKGESSHSKESSKGGGSSSGSKHSGSKSGSAKEQSIPAEQSIARKMGNTNSSPRAAEKDKKRHKKRGHRSKKSKSKKSKKNPGDYPLLVRFFGFKGNMKRAHHTRHTHHKKGKDAKLVFHKDSDHKKRRKSHRSSHQSSKGDSKGDGTRHSRHGSSRHGHRGSSRHRPGRDLADSEKTIPEHSVFEPNSNELQLYDRGDLEAEEDEYSSGTEDLTPTPSQRLSDEPLRPDDSISGIMGRMHLNDNRG